MRLHRLAFATASIWAATLSAQAPSTDSLDAFVRTQMARRHIQGLSLAIAQGGRIVYARGYGVTDSAEGRRVDTTTLFQAGSISKPTSALAALHLVEQGRLSLDEDVNQKLTSWHVANTRFTASKPVTLRGLLTHTAGLTVHGFPGYDADSVRPTLVQVLNGTSPANTAAIVTDTFPGSLNRYSGGGYTIMQQMMVDVTGKPFPRLLKETVLTPLGMGRSSFEQPLPPNLAANTAAGHYQDGSMVHGRWHVYPEMAAAGLWTTASDLVRVALGTQQAYSGRSRAVISQSMAKQMLTPFMGSGLGFGVRPLDSGVVRFGHNGRDEGFDALLTATTTGKAYAIMINANDDSRFMRRIADYVERAYGWPGTRPLPARAAIPMSADEMRAFEGLYDSGGGRFVSLVASDGWLFTTAGGGLDEQFVPIGDNAFLSAERDMRLTFNRDASGAVTSVSLAGGASPLTAPRLGPLFGRVDRGTLDARSIDTGVAVLRALATTGLTATTPVTAGARRDFGSQTWGEIRGLRDVQYVGSSIVTGGEVARHGSAVARLGYYRVAMPSASKLVVAYFTGDGLVTDVDVVDR